MVDINICSYALQKNGEQMIFNFNCAQTDYVILVLSSQFKERDIVSPDFQP